MWSDFRFAGLKTTTLYLFQLVNNSDIYIYKRVTF